MHENPTAYLDTQIFNHLVKQFDFTLRNHPESTIPGRIGAAGCIEYLFKAFGSVAAILCVEAKFKRGSPNEPLDAIAQVIAECNGMLTRFRIIASVADLLNIDCHLNNDKYGFSLPIHCILCDGESFQFFKFEGTPPLSFLRGCVAGDPNSLRRGLPIYRLDETPTFILQLRRICETVFDTMLCAYVSALKAYHKRSRMRGRQRVRVLIDGMKR